MKYLTFIFLLSLMGLSACTSLDLADQNVCKTTNWGVVGKQDGVAGHDRSRLDDYIEMCKSQDVTVEKYDWEAGYRIGLMQYCKPSNAYAEGRAGRPLQDVCPARLQYELMKHHEHGVRYFKTHQELKSFMSQGIAYNSQYSIHSGAVKNANLNRISLQPRSPFYNADLSRLQRKRELYANADPKRAN
jgi:hypothetical protein